VLFKTIMCPFKDKCPKDKKPRWPDSNVTSVTQFGEACPFAHHTMEIQFPEKIITEISAAKNAIKNLQKKAISEQKEKPFIPTGGLYNCNGCGKEVCNWCKYQKSAEETMKKYNKSKK